MVCASVSIGIMVLYRVSDISRKKKKNFAGFSGANLRKNWPISRDFHGKKVKIRGKISRFHEIFAGESQNSQKNRPISREILGGNFAKKQSVKNSRFRWIFFGKFR